MTETQTGFGIIGLGTIGENMALQALEEGFRVVAYDVKSLSPELREAGVESVAEPEEFSGALERPRVIFLYVPAGATVDNVLNALIPVLEPGDVIVDGGNSYWGDSQRRHKDLFTKGLHFVDLGTSGGRDGARSGSCFMVGCDDDVFPVIEPILQGLAVEEGVVHAGTAGAGHFVKLVHNGIEFGMLQAIGEGVSLLDRYYTGDRDQVAAVLEAWRHGSVIRSWLIDLVATAYGERAGLDSIPAYVEDTGEVNWLLGDALSMEVPVPVISQSVMSLLGSRDERQISLRAIGAMRNGFGDHPLGPDDGIARHRRASRVGPLSRPEAWQ